MSFDINKFFNRLKGAWNKLIAIAAWLMLIIGSFFLPPPVGATQFGSGGKLSAFGKVVVALCVGLIIVPVSRYSRKRYTWRWWKGGVVALGFSIVSFFAYEWFGTRWTCSYAQKPVVIGSEFVPGREQWVKTNGVYVNCHDWLMAHGGKVEDIWTKESIDRRCAALSAVYIFALPLFVIAIICVLQAIYCNSSRS